jgi:pyruvate formate lyase activating enzyme
VPVKGFQGTSLLDFPGRIASLVFFSGCNLSCPFCHNPDLLDGADRLPDFPLTELIAELRRRRNFIDGVVITGGEPTLASELVPLVRQIKALGLLVKVDTNGLAPGMLSLLMREGLVDFIALDLKTSPERYGELHDRPIGLGPLERTLQLLKTGQIEYELRTTCVPGFVTEPDIRQLGPLVKGAKHWVFQQYAPGHALSEKYRALEPYPVARIRQLAALAAEYVEVVSFRGV